MKEPHHLLLRLLPCCHNQQIVSILSLSTRNEGFWLPISERRLHGQAGAGTQSFCLIREKVSLLHFLVCANLRFKKRWGWVSNQQDRCITGLRQSGCLLKDPFTTHYAIERNHDGLVGGVCNRSGWDMLVLWRMQEEQGGRSRCEDILGHA